MTVLLNYFAMKLLKRFTLSFGCN